MDFSNLKIDEEAMKRAIEKSAEELKEKHERRITFIAERQPEVMEELSEILKEQRGLDNDDIYYEENKYSISSEEFEFLFDNIFRYAKEMALMNEDRENMFMFPNEMCFLKYKDLRIIVKIMHGQGTAMIFHIAEEKDWIEEESFCFSEVQENVHDFLTEKEDSKEKKERKIIREAKKIRKEAERLKENVVKLKDLSENNQKQKIIEETEKKLNETIQLLIELKKK